MFVNLNVLIREVKKRKITEVVLNFYNQLQNTKSVRVLGIKSYDVFGLLEGELIKS